MNKKTVNEFNTKKLPIIVDNQDQYDLVKLKNELIDNLQFKLDLTLQGIFLFSLTQLYKFKNGAVKFKTKDVCYKTGLSYDYMRHFTSDKIYFAKQFSSLQWSTEHISKTGKKQLDWLPVISRAGYNGDTKEWLIKINPEILPYFQNLQNNFFLIDIRDWKKFKCVYSLPLLALIRAKVLATTSGVKTFTIKELKDRLGVNIYTNKGVFVKDLYPDGNNFLKRVIYPAIKEINAIKNDREYSGLSLPNVFNLEIVNGKNKLILNKYDKQLNPEGIVNPADFVNNFTLEKFNFLQKQGRFHAKAKYDRRSILAIKFKVKNLTNYKAQKIAAAKRKELSAEHNLANLQSNTESKKVKTTKKSNKIELNLTGKKCPLCSEGDQVIQKNSNEGKEFYACSRFPKCKYVGNINEKFIRTDKPCSKCDDGVLLIRPNPKTKKMFYGCSNYPECKYTENMSEQDELKHLNTYDKQGQEFKDFKKEGDLCPECKAKNINSKLEITLGKKLVVCAKCNYLANVLKFSDIK